MHSALGLSGGPRQTRSVEGRSRPGVKGDILTVKSELVNSLSYGSR